MARYRVVERPDGWIVEILDGIPVVLGETVVTTPQWVKASDPFSSKEDAEREAKRLEEEH
jgi:hypothetical protein